MARLRTNVQPGSAGESAGGSPTADLLLAWYDRHRRDLPWRATPGGSVDPYAVWLSEIMLQQTTVAAVRAYYLRFLAQWPTVFALADAPLEAVLQAWAGLGYYSRARNLHACARVVVTRFGGRFPASETLLRELPGIGAYTAAAIAAIAFDQRAVVVDGNVERVMARLFAIETPLPAGRRAVHAAMDWATPQTRVGDFAQAVMDLGATICTPKSPACVICPLLVMCRGRQTGETTRYPVKLARKPVPLREGAIFVVERDDGAMLVRTRPAKGLFGGMTEFPGTEWSEQFPMSGWNPPAGIVEPGPELGVVEHGLTHFSLRLHVFRARASHPHPEGCRWSSADRIETEALPTLMRKVLALARQ